MKLERMTDMEKIENVYEEIGLKWKKRFVKDAMLTIIPELKDFQEGVIISLDEFYEDFVSGIVFFEEKFIGTVSMDEDDCTFKKA